MSEWLDIFISSTRDTMGQVGVFLPKLLGALLLLILGFLVAKLVEKAFVRFFQIIGINRVAKKSGIKNTLSSFDIKNDLAWVFARLLFWVVLFVFLLPISNLLGLVFFADLVNQIVSYIPNILAALIMILLGSWAAKILSGLARGSAARVGSEYAEVLGTLVNLMILLITIIIALRQLNIEVQILSNILLVVFGSMAIGFALAFAFGAKDVLRLIISGIYINRTLNPGSRIKLNDLEGTIVEVGSIMTVIEKDNKERVSIPNSHFLS